VSLWKSWPVREERHDRANGPGPARSGVGSRLRSLSSRAERLLSLKSFQHMSDAIFMRSTWCAYPHARQRMHARLYGGRCAALGSTRSEAALGLASERYCRKACVAPACAWRPREETLVSPMVPLQCQGRLPQESRPGVKGQVAWSWSDLACVRAAALAFRHRCKCVIVACEGSLYGLPVRGLGVPSCCRGTKVTPRFSSA
jgi:hypothetical protein